MPDLETMGYYVIVATAGHDTTSSAMAGGLQALADNPDQLAKLQAQPELLNNAVEEMIRWTAPLRHVMRTATADAEVLELAGDPTTMKTTFVGGHKTLPIRYSLTR